MSLSTILFIAGRDAPSIERFRRLDVAASITDIDLQDRLDFLDNLIDVEDLQTSYPSLSGDILSTYNYNGAAMSDDEGETWTHSFSLSNYDESVWTDILQYEFSTYDTIWKWAKFEPDLGDPYALLETNIPEIDAYVNSIYTAYAVFGAMGLVEYNYV